MGGGGGLSGKGGGGEGDGGGGEGDTGGGDCICITFSQAPLCTCLCAKQSCVCTSHVDERFCHHAQAPGVLEASGNGSENHSGYVWSIGALHLG